MSKRIVHLGSAALLIILGILVGFKLKEDGDEKQDDQLSYEENIKKFESVVQFVDKNYFEEVNQTQLVEDAIEGMLKGLDPHSFYLPPPDMEQVSTQMQGSFEGIGIQFNILNDTIVVVSPISGGPSEKLGIQAGDRIVKVEGEEVAGVGITNQDVIDMLRGKKGTKVEVKIKRPGVPELIPFTITRDKIPLHSVDVSYMIDDKNGYIKINRFSSTTYREFSKHLGQLRQRGMENLVLDLRRNPGGYLQMAHRIADVFLKQGEMIVYTKGRTSESNRKLRATGRIDKFEDGGLVVLIDRGSASASEIVSGAVQDHDRGLVIGRRSFGKGLVQSQHKLLDKSAIRVVTARYFTPSGRCIQKPFDKGEKEYKKEILNRVKHGELFSADSIKLPDSLKYETDHGRTVYGGGGIMPDVFVPLDTSDNSEYFRKLRSNQVFTQFGLQYKDNHPEVKERYADGVEFAQKFVVSQQLLAAFKQYAKNHGVEFDKKGFERSQAPIKTWIRAMIGRSFFDDKGFYPTLHSSDQVFQKAVSMMPDAVKLKKTGIMLTAF
jgi:carboxyl-terminal processing protease